MKNLIFIIFCIAFSLKIYAHGTIIVQGVEHEEGFIDVKIYLDKNSFLKEDLATVSLRKKPTKGETIIPLSKLHEGDIAVVIYHDENNDEKLNTGLFWSPKEGYAFSNNYKPKSPPKFKKAKIYLTHGKTIKIKLNY